jgi:hypothetical protein
LIYATGRTHAEAWHRAVEQAGEILRDEKGKGKPVVEVSLLKTRVTDDGLKHLAGLKSLQGLILADTKVTDAGLKHLAGLKSLQDLYLASTKVTAKGVVELKKPLPKLKIVD